MQKITSTLGLKDAIRQLEYKQAVEGRLLKEQFDLAVDSLRPVNLIRTTFTELFTAPNLLKTILSASVGLSAGYFSKRLLGGTSGRLVRKVLGLIF